MSTYLFIALCLHTLALTVWTDKRKNKTNKQKNNNNNNKKNNNNNQTMNTTIDQEVN